MFQLPSPLQKIETDLTRKQNIHLFLKRDDLIHPEISGNKWRKLKYSIAQAKEEKKDTLLTFGGAYSNHITATAAAGKYFGFKTIGVIRGEAYSPLNKSLQFAQDSGMQFIYLDRENYKTKNIDSLLKDFDTKKVYILPEGGANLLGVKGCSEIVDEINVQLKNKEGNHKFPSDFDYICCPCGTGTTLAGIASNLLSHQNAIGFPVLKNGEFLYDEIKKLTSANFQLITDYHFGGYAKTSTVLVDFIKKFYIEQAILLDYVYTGKMLFGIFDLISKQYFPENSTVIAVHTGGVMNANVFELV